MHFSPQVIQKRADIRYEGLASHVGILMSEVKMAMTVKIAVPKPRTIDTLPEGIDPGISLILESYPHIGNKIVQLWGSIELQRYLTTLIIDERGNRQGFPPPIASALLRIYEDHDKLVPEDSRGDPWHSVIL